MPAALLFRSLSSIPRSIVHSTTRSAKISNMFSSVAGPSWNGWDAIKHLVVFGDSYSSVGFDLVHTHPTRHMPLGIEFPGMTFTEDMASPNWVGHLITMTQKENPLIVHDYAIGGHTVSGVKNQVSLKFLPHAGTKPDWFTWDEKNTLFITWVGINDCAFSTEHDDDLEDLFAVQDSLHEIGARNYMFIDVPPIHRSPAVRSFRQDPDTSASLTYESWNESLNVHAERFHARHPDSSVFMFSSWNTFNTILDDPVKYGFTKDDASKAGGRIWMDYLHPTSRVHEVIAGDILKFLRSIPSNQSDKEN